MDTRRQRRGPIIIHHPKADFWQLELILGVGRRSKLRHLALRSGLSKACGYAGLDRLCA
jgi:hypothetical protein